VAWLSALYNCSEEDETRAQRSEFIRDYNYNSKPTKLDEGPAAESHRRRPTTSTVAACERRLDFLTAFRSPVTVARNSDCAFNTVLGPPHQRRQAVHGSWTNATRVEVTTSTSARDGAD